MYIEINGLDESGSVGETILFVRVGTGLLNESQIFLRNIDFFNSLIASKNILKGYDSSTLLKYVLSFIEDPSFDVTIFRIFPEAQLKILRSFSILTAKDLYSIRGTFVKLFDSKGNLAKVDRKMVKEISEATNKLKRFRKPEYWLDSFVKSYGMMLATLKLADMLKTKPGFTSYFWVIQADGGYPFVFWWRDVIGKKKHFKKGTFVISGVSNGDRYYPVISTAGIIAASLLRNIDKLHGFPVYPLKYNDDFDVAHFYESHSKAIEIPTFQHRVLFIGKIPENLRACIPYLIHKRDRHKTYEPFHVGTSMKWFFKKYSPGKPENTIIVYGGELSQKDKENIDFCREKKYPVFHISEFKKDFQKLLNELNTEIQYFPENKKQRLSTRLKNIEQDCMSKLD